jgi:type II secretory pathway component GspD/PulD (secretin)
MILHMAVTLTTLATTNNTPLPELKAYSLGLADGPNAVTVITNMLGADARVVFEPGTRKLLIIASSNQHAIAAMIIKELNVPPKNVSITVNFRGMGNSDRTSASVTGGARVTRSKQGGTQTTIRFNPDLVDQHSETTSNTRQQLLVISGKSAILSIGEDVPYIEWIMDYGFHHRIIEQQLQWQRVGSFLVIEPTVVGEGPLIRVKLTPELSGLVDNSPYRTRFETVSTEVVVSDGVPFTIGGGGQNQDFYSRFLIGVDRSGKRQNLTIEMTATILPASNARP